MTVFKIVLEVVREYASTIKLPWVSTRERIARKVFIELANLVNNFVFYLPLVFISQLLLLGLNTQYCVFLTFKYSLFAHNQLYTLLNYWFTVVVKLAVSQSDWYIVVSAAKENKLREVKCDMSLM